MVCEGSVLGQVRKALKKLGNLLKGGFRKFTELVTKA